MTLHEKHESMIATIYDYTCCQFYHLPYLLVAFNPYIWGLNGIKKLKKS
jgi:hypothetical protein